MSSERICGKRCKQLIVPVDTDQSHMGNRRAMSSNNAFADGQFDDPCDAPSEQFKNLVETNYAQTFLAPAPLISTSTPEAPHLVLQPTQVKRKKGKKRQRSVPYGPIRNEEADADIRAFRSLFKKIKEINSTVKLLGEQPAEIDKVQTDERGLSRELCLSYHCQGGCDKRCNKRASHRKLSPSEKGRLLHLLTQVATSIEAEAAKMETITTIAIEQPLKQVPVEAQVSQQEAGVDNDQSEVDAAVAEENPHKRLKTSTTAANKHQVDPGDFVPNGTSLDNPVDLTFCEKNSNSSSLNEALEFSSSAPSEESEDPQPCKKSLSRKKLQLVKAKLELAKQKLAIQANQNQQQPGEPAPTHAVASNNPVQLALQQARAKLQGALKNRDRALLQQQQQPKFLAPISALSASLIIKNISQTGPAENIYFHSMNQRIDLKRRHEYKELIQTNQEHKVSLSARKAQLEKDLSLLGERLKVSTSSTSTVTTMTKEELQRKLEEAQAHKDISYWRHFVSKQEHLLASVQSRMQENSDSLQQCAQDMGTNVEQSQQSKADAETLELRQGALVSLIATSTNKLLEMRQRVHESKENEE